MEKQSEAVKAANIKQYHVVSAFVTESQITLGEITVNEKSNEIKAVPLLISRQNPISKSNM